MQSFSSHTITTPQGITISYTKGKGPKKPSLVFLHGLGGSKEAWNPVRAMLQKQGWQSYAIDLRGHGASHRPSGKNQYAIEKLSSDIAHVIEKEKMAAPILIGHCLGGMVALHVASTLPAKLSGLVLIATGTQLEKGKKIAQQALLQSLLSFAKTHAPGFRKKGRRDFLELKGTGNYSPQRIVGDILHTSPRSYAASLHTMTTFQASPSLSKITIPTLLVAGSKDPLFPAASMKKLQQKLPHAAFHIVAEGNHVLVLNNPRTLAATITSWLPR